MWLCSFWIAKASLAQLADRATHLHLLAANPLAPWAGSICACLQAQLQLLQVAARCRHPALHSQHVRAAPKYLVSLRLIGKTSMHLLVALTFIASPQGHVMPQSSKADEASHLMQTCPPGYQACLVQLPQIFCASSSCLKACAPWGLQLHPGTGDLRFNRLGVQCGSKGASAIHQYATGVRQGYALASMPHTAHGKSRCALVIVKSLPAAGDRVTEDCSSCMINCKSGWNDHASSSAVVSCTVLPSCTAI